MKNKRKYPRKFCSESSFFATRYGIHECYIKNLGNKGAFIETDLFLPEGNVVTVAVPDSEQNNSIKRKGKVDGSIWIWCGIQGCHPYLDRLKMPSD